MLNVNLFDGNFSHTKDVCGYITSTYYTKPNKIIWEPKRMVWDGITVFTDGYIDDDIVCKVSSNYKVAWLIEPRSIDPTMYEKIVQNHERFDYILTFDEELKQQLPDKILPYVMGQTRIADEDCQYYSKQFLTSMIASHKTMSEGHRFRHEIVKALQEKHGFEMWGSGYKPFKDKLEALKSYCFSISVLNCKRKDYFTEILIDNFRTMTIPILWGLPNVGDYFNTDGIISFDTIEELDEILTNLTPDDYIKRADAMIENFELAKKYLCTDDMIADIFIEKFKL